MELLKSGFDNIRYGEDLKDSVDVMVCNKAGNTEDVSENFGLKPWMQAELEALIYISYI
jgi:hypothetical protein